MNEKNNKELHKTIDEVSSENERNESGENKFPVRLFSSKEEIIKSVSQTGSVINIKDKFFLKTPAYGSGWDLYEIKKTKKDEYTFDNLGYNMRVEYAVKKIINIVIQNKNKVYPDLSSFLEDYKRVEKTLANILP